MAIARVSPDAARGAEDPIELESSEDENSAAETRLPAAKRRRPAATASMLPLPRGRTSDDEHHECGCVVVHSFDRAPTRSASRVKKLQYGLRFEGDPRLVFTATGQYGPGFTVRASAAALDREVARLAARWSSTDDRRHRAV